jgi:hypothetical protein
MARKSSKPGEVNKSQVLRELLTKNPEMKASEAIATLAKQGLKVIPSMYYFVKGKMSGKKGRRKKARRMVEKVSATMSSNGPAKTGDVISTILKVKHLAAEVGGLKKLAALVDALGE